MDRRTFVGMVAGALLAAPVDVGAQQRGKLLRVIGWLDLSWTGSGSSSPLYPFRRRLAELGWIEGRDIAFVARSAENKPERLPDLAAELVALGPEVIVTLGTPATLAARKATARIPIVMTGTDNPVADDLISSLRRPGGNVTGMANNPGPEFYQKMLQYVGQQDISPVQRLSAARTRIGRRHPGVADSGIRGDRNANAHGSALGLRTRNRLMHDGLSFTRQEAIQRHPGQATSVTARYNALPAAQKSLLMQFLDSL